MSETQVLRCSGQCGTDKAHQLRDGAWYCCRCGARAELGVVVPAQPDTRRVAEEARQQLEQGHRPEYREALAPEQLRALDLPDEAAELRGSPIGRIARGSKGRNPQRR